MPTRKTVVIGVVVLVSVIFGGTVIVSYLAWSTIENGPDRLVAIGDIVVGATLVLTAVAVGVGLAAYQVSTGAPELEPEITFRCSEPNRPVFLAEEETGSGTLRLVSFRQVEASVSVHNRSSVSAHNPAMRIDLLGLGGVRSQHHWRPVDRSNQVGVQAIQWDGGSQFAIHGNGTRVLPQLSFEDVFAIPDDGPGHALEVTLEADGFKTISTIPVELRTYEAYVEHCAGRAGRHGPTVWLPGACEASRCRRRAEMRLLVLHPENGPTELTACADCAGAHGDLRDLPVLHIVDNLDRRRELHRPLEHRDAGVWPPHL